VDGVGSIGGFDGGAFFPGQDNDSEAGQLGVAPQALAQGRCAILRQREM
jgi:hypothetical protein